MIRRANQLRDDGSWIRSPTISRFAEIATATRALLFMVDVATVRSCFPT